MRQRIITGVAGAIILIVVLALGTPFVEAAVTVLALMAVYEILHATNMLVNKKLAGAALLGSLGIMTAQSFDKVFFAPALYIYIAVLFAVFMANRNEIGFEGIAGAFLAVVYPSFMLGHIMYIRVMENGHLLVWAVFVGAFMTDTFAMLGGKYFGRKKLCPSLSPKKTVEGSACGVLGCVASFVVYCLICQIFFDVQPNYLNAVIIALGVSVVSQVGDLAASCIKREFGIKDYGRIMPGHGGIMDRFDSVLFAAPLIYYALYILPIFK